MASRLSPSTIATSPHHTGTVYCVFSEPVHGYVWCSRHGWALVNEWCVCDDCAEEAWMAQYESTLAALPLEVGVRALDLYEQRGLVRSASLPEALAAKERTADEAGRNQKGVANHP